MEGLGLETSCWLRRRMRDAQILSDLPEFIGRSQNKVLHSSASKAEIDGYLAKLVLDSVLKKNQITYIPM